MSNTNIFTYKDLGNSEFVKNNVLGCSTIISYHGELSTKSAVWARFTHTGGGTHEAQCSVFEEPMWESAKHGNPNSRCVVVSSTEEIIEPNIHIPLILKG